MVLFDVRTLFFVGAVSAIVCATMLWLSRGLHGPSRPGLAWSAASQASFGVAMLLISLRGAIPDVLSWPVANAIGSGAAALMYEGVRRLCGARPMPWLAGGTIAALCAVHAVLGSERHWVDLRLQLTSVLQGGFSAAAIPLLLARLRRDDEPRAPLRWAVGFLAVFACGHAARFVVVAASGAPVAATGIVQGPAQALMPTVFSIAPMVYSLILIGLVNGRIATELWTLATVDTLTGVRTRRAFIEEARRALAPGARPVLMMLDLDRFKQVNDRHGHASGDRVLQRFARLLRDECPRGAVIGRYGGEEFCLMLAGAAPRDGLALAQRLCDTVRATPFGLAVPDVTVTVSIGLACPADGATLEELLIAADRRLYRAKATGRDRVVAHDGAPGPDTRPMPAASEPDATAPDAAAPDRSVPDPSVRTARASGLSTG
jgi:diguanylate cyclase (GGDEF)-like protein